MRHLFARLTLVALAVLLTAGPLYALPLAPASGSSLTAPAPGGHSSARALLSLVGSIAIFGSIANMKDPATLSKKFVSRAQNAQGDYQTGVAAAGATWEQHAGASEQAWEQGVQQAVTKKRFASGVQGKGGKYQTNAANLGPNRYSQGVGNAGDAWARGVAPAQGVLKSLSLPPRSYRGAPSNAARSTAVQTALAALRMNK